MIEALEKIKAGFNHCFRLIFYFIFTIILIIVVFFCLELMLLGFISLLLTVGTSYVAKICVPKSLGNKWLPCDKKIIEDEDDDKGKEEHRKLLSFGEEIVWRRALAGATDEYDYCDKQVSANELF